MEINIEQIIEETSFQDEIYTIVENNNFSLKIDYITGDYLTLAWIHIKNKEYINGTELLKSLIPYSKKRNLKYIHAYGIKGYDMAYVNNKMKLITTNGYYTLMRWGFIPYKKEIFLNKVLKTDYKSLEDAYSDPNFWINWKERGIAYVGDFDLEENSLSYKVLNKEFNLPVM